MAGVFAVSDFWKFNDPIFQSNVTREISVLSGVASRCKSNISQLSFINIRRFYRLKRSESEELTCERSIKRAKKPVGDSLIPRCFQQWGSIIPRTKNRSFVRRGIYRKNHGIFASSSCEKQGEFYVHAARNIQLVVHFRFFQLPTAYLSVRFIPENGCNHVNRDYDLSGTDMRVWLHESVGQNCPHRECKWFVGRICKVLLVFMW